MDDRVTEDTATGGCHRGDPESDPHLTDAIEHAAHLLPAQGPITVFIHHNTLHALEHLPFEQAVEQGARIFGCRPYLSEDRYREALRRGRIRVDELRAVLAEDLGDRADARITGLGTRLRVADGDASVSARHRPDGGIAVVRRRARCAAARARRGVGGDARSADRRDAALGNARPARRQ